MNIPRKRRFFTDSYETEIKISLVLLICFLLSLNFFSAYSLGKARQAQASGFNDNLELALESIRSIIQANHLNLPEIAYLSDMAAFAHIEAIEICDSLGVPVMSIRSPDDEILKNAITDSAAVKDKNGSVVYTIAISAANRAGSGLQRLAVYDALIRIAGLVAGLLVAYLFIRSVMNPYRKIKKEASHLNLPQVNLDDADGVEYAVRMFQEVIRELKQKESLLQAMYDNSEKRADSLARYNEYILGSISSGVIICDNQGIITRFNPAAEKIVGAEEQFVQGRLFTEVFGKRHQISTVLSEALDHNRTFSRTEFEISRQDGEKLWIGLSSSLISDNRGEKVGAAVLLTDLTSIKRLQEISDFTEKMAALGEMSAGLAHELRNSVAAIVGFGKLLDKTASPDEKSHSIINMIIAESMNTEEMLRRFLNFANPLKIVPQMTVPAVLLSESIKTAREVFTGKRIEAVIRDNSEGIAIYADPMLLKNALSNLIQNAFQAMGDQGRLQADIDVIEKKGLIRICISDTGGGISPEVLPKIFNPFFTTKDKGTGLGLALVKKIITGHMGTIGVQSSPEIGTTFTINLPVKPKEGKQEQTPYLSREKTAVGKGANDS